MRQLRYAAAVAVGFAICFIIRTSVDAEKMRRHGESRFVEGRLCGVRTVQEEAVREGHGHWAPRPDHQLPNLFAWNPVRVPLDASLDVSSSDAP